MKPLELHLPRHPTVASFMRSIPQIGPGKRSVLTYHRQIEAANRRAAKRKAAGRYVWP